MSALLRTSARQPEPHPNLEASGPEDLYASIRESCGVAAELAAPLPMLISPNTSLAIASTDAQLICPPVVGNAFLMINLSSHSRKAARQQEFQGAL